jgi:predicted O-methyltransferase YrrM
MSPYATVLDHIEKFVPCCPGWCSVNKAHVLASIIFATRPKWILEIGVWNGRSLIPMAMAAKAVGVVEVVGVDPWSAEESVKNQTEKHVEHWSKQKIHDEAYRNCTAMIERFRLNDTCHVIRETSDKFVWGAGPIGLLHIDGNHSIQSTKDVNRFAPLVEAGGFCVMDDIHWENNGPADALKALKSLGFRELFSEMNLTVEPNEDYSIWQKL